MIIVASIALIIQNPLSDPNSQLSQFLNELDLVLTVVFTLEVCIKILAFGFIACGPKSFLRSIWNIMDLVIVLTSLAS
jgi:hypothetical protein